MAHTVLKISWSSGTEMVPILSNYRKGQEIRTTELWATGDGSLLVFYTAIVEDYARRAEQNTLRLRYIKKGQKDKRVMRKQSAVRWGTSIISWSLQRKIGEAQWIDNVAHSRFHGTAKVSVPVRQKTSAIPRKFGTVIVGQRPHQQQLRQELLTYAGACALTGETEQGALDVAHIIPVKEDDHENDLSTNAILLRADLHRLFDVGLFWFHITSDKAVVRCSSLLSEGYKRLLTDRKLRDTDYDRVAPALRDRAKLPGGRGRSLDQ